MLKFISRIFGTTNDRIIKKLRKEVEQINNFESELEKLSDKELQAKTQYFKDKLKNGSSLNDIAHEAFAVVREASKRVLGKRHYDVQMVGGLILHRGNITEMRTGEGKTLVATLPSYLNALEGKGVHVVTTNDYLAMRDAEWMGKIHKFMGLSVGCIAAGISEPLRKAAYDADITYATNNELGFDYLRDNMKHTKESRVQREFNYAIVDEVDSILIDEARTPLIISGPVDDNTDLYNVINKIVAQLNVKDFEKDEKTKTINLTEAGIEECEKLLTKVSLIKENTGLFDFENMKYVHFINQSLKAHHLFSKDVDYLMNKNQVMIIDEFTGRAMEGRRYSDGLHQAIEAKENVEIQNENQTLASITFQNYFRLYNKLSGMTGTAMTEAAELKDIYNLEVISVPTNITPKRIDSDDEIYGTAQEKYDAIIETIKNCYEKGQPVLVGTVSIEKSEEISDILTKNKIPHNVLNAKNHESEAYIIAQAGRYKAITIATNMAGRGTDIQLGGNAEMMIEQIDNKLGKDKRAKREKEILAQVEEENIKVKEAGGLYVLGTERHESRRIDNQLRGRCGRQGDPGESKFFLSLEDDLMRIFASDRISGILRNIGLKDGEAIHHPMINRSLQKAQQKVEAHNFETRKNLLKFDNVMNDQRKVIYDQRNDIMDADSLNITLEDFYNQVVDSIVRTCIPPESFRDVWDLKTLDSEIERISGIDCEIEKFKEKDATEEDIKNHIIQVFKTHLDEKRKIYTDAIYNQATKYIFLSSLDSVWKDHLHALDHLRQGITLRAYAQKDPLNEYKREAYNLFSSMLDTYTENVVTSCFHFRIDTSHLNIDEATRRADNSQNYRESREDPAFAKYNSKGKEISTSLKPIKSQVAPEDRDKDNPSTWGKVSRNESCPCGSGKKYKHCHGSI